jgi:hypothetical protein
MSDEVWVVSDFRSSLYIAGIQDPEGAKTFPGENHNGTGLPFPNGNTLSPVSG